MARQGREAVLHNRAMIAAAAIACAALVLWPVTLRAAADDPISTADAGDAVPGHAGLTYLDLVRQAVPDLALSPDDHRVEGHLATAPRALGGEVRIGAAPLPVTLGAIEAVHIQAGGKPRLVLLADLGDQPRSLSAVLLFDDSGPSPTLLDLADVAADKFTSFHDQPPIRLSPADDALVTDSEHDTDDGQAFTSRLLLFVRGDRFQRIDRFALLADSGCNWSRTETPVFSTRPTAGSPYAEIDVTVTRTLLSRPDTCGHAPKPITSTFVAAWRWDTTAGAFTADRGALDDLAKLNATRF
jgi:hypothetical protein